MKKISIISLANVEAEKREEKINAALTQLQREGKEILDIKILGVSEYTVIIYYNEVYGPLYE